MNIVFYSYVGGCYSWLLQNIDWQILATFISDEIDDIDNGAEKSLGQFLDLMTAKVWSCSAIHNNLSIIIRNYIINDWLENMNTGLNNNFVFHMYTSYLTF